MSTKTLASAGASLLNRFFFFTNALHFRSQHHASFLLPRIASSSSLQPFLAKFEGRGGGEAAETLKVSASIDEFSFPCGLPSLRFFIEDGNVAALGNEPLQLLPKRTYQPSHVKRKRTHGFLARKSTKGGTEGDCSENRKR